MIVTQIDDARGEVTLSLEIDDERLARHFDIASRRVSQRVNIPGFRKGKAPKSVLVNHLGREYLLEESLETLVPEAVAEAVREQGLDPWALPQVEIAAREPTVTLTATVPLRPTVELGDYQSLRLEDEAEEVTEEQVDGVVERIRYQYSYTMDVDRASRQGDVVVLTAVARMGETVLFDVTDQEFLIDPNNQVRVEGFSEAVEGTMPGDEKVFQGNVRGDSEEGDEGGDADGEQGQVADVKIQVKEVKEVVLPDLDDDLAKTYGAEGVETLDALRQHIRTELETASERQFRNVLENKVLAELIEGSEFQVSPIIIEREGRNLLDRELQRRQEYLGRRAPKLRLDDIAPDSFEAAERAAEMNIKRALVLEKIAELEQVEISDDVVRGEIDGFNASIQGTEIGPMEDTPENWDSIRDNLRTRRALDIAIDIARRTDQQD